MAKRRALWMDLLTENYNYGIDIFENPANRTTNFSYTFSNGTFQGFLDASANGYYLALADPDHDGKNDCMARQQNRLVCGPNARTCTWRGQDVVLAA